MIRRDNRRRRDCTTSQGRNRRDPPDRYWRTTRAALRAAAFVDQDDPGALEVELLDLPLASEEDWHRWQDEQALARQREEMAYWNRLAMEQAEDEACDAFSYYCRRRDAGLPVPVRYAQVQA